MVSTRATITKVKNYFHLLPLFTTFFYKKIIDLSTYIKIFIKKVQFIEISLIYIIKCYFMLLCPCAFYNIYYL
jgi:hypothetical protein